MTFEEAIKHEENMVTKSVKNTGVVGSVKSEVPIEVSGEYFNYCPKCRRRLN